MIRDVYYVIVITPGDYVAATSVMRGGATRYGGVSVLLLDTSIRFAICALPCFIDAAMSSFFADAATLAAYAIFSPRAIFHCYFVTLYAAATMRRASATRRTDYDDHDDDRLTRRHTPDAHTL